MPDLGSLLPKWTKIARCPFKNTKMPHCTCFMRLQGGGGLAGAQRLGGCLHGWFYQQDTKDHWEIKGRFPKGWFWRTYPRSGFRSVGTSAETTLLETTLLETTKKGHWEIKGRFPKGWFWRTYPRSGFRSGGTSAETTLLETTLLRTTEKST